MRSNIKSEGFWKAEEKEPEFKAKMRRWMMISEEKEQK